jgi:multidrug efflux pump subunit AcrA (membrane-fusion protein)
MKQTVPRGQQPAQEGEVMAVPEASRPPGRGRRAAPVNAAAMRTVIAAGTIAAVAAGTVWAWRAGALSSPEQSASGQQGAPAPATRPVTRQAISATTPVSATLGYAGSYQVTGQGSGTLTWLPSAGQVIDQGQTLYKTDNGSPVALLYGSVPAWRTLDEGLTGQDVSQLNQDLVHLGYASRADIAALSWDYYSWETAVGVQHLEEHLGVSSPPGTLSLGQVVFEPAALRVSQLTGALGGQAAGPVLSATSDRHVVTINLDAAQQSEVKAGDAVTVRLPDGTTTPGVISSIGTVATSTQGSGTQGSGGSATATIPVQVRLTDPKAAGTLDQAPVTVNITTSTARNALVVPVTALLAQSPGGYAVEVAGPGNTRRLVPVTVGLTDDSDGLVQVTGALTPGQRVVVPAT